jgi:hypothetical protein
MLLNPAVQEKFDELVLSTIQRFKCSVEDATRAVAVQNFGPQFTADRLARFLIDQAEHRSALLQAQNQQRKPDTGEYMQFLL